jgi:hypothetical protein
MAEGGTVSGPRYCIIPADALDDDRVSDLHLRVLTDFGRAADRNGWLQANQSIVARRLNRSRETVNRTIRDLVDWGYLRKNQRFSDKDGRQMVNRYQVVMDRAERADDVISAQPEMENQTPPCDVQITGGVTSGDHTPCDLQTSHHKNDPLLQRPSSSPPGKEIEREARARGSEDRKKPDRDFERIWHAWPWAHTGDRDTAKAAWLALSSEDRFSARDRAAKWLEAYSAAGKKFPPAVSKYLSQRRWEDMPEPEPETAQPAYAKVFSPVWATRRTCLLIAGPTVHVPLKDWERTAIAEGRLDPAELDRGNRMRRGFPAVNAMDAMAVERGAGFSAPTPDEERLAKLCEFVPVDTEVWEAWRHYFDGQGWPWPPHGPRGGFFPAGGPERLSEFEAAIRGEDDAGGREAAE